MPTVKLVDENDPNPIVQKVFRDIKETKGIDRVPNIWRALATHPQHLSLCWTELKNFMRKCLTSEIQEGCEMGGKRILHGIARYGILSAMSVTLSERFHRN